MVWSQNQRWKAYNLCIVVSKGTTRCFFQAISFHVRWKADVISVGHAGTSMAPVWRTICFTHEARPLRRTLRTWQFMRAMYMIATWHVFHFSIYTRNCFKSRDWRYALPHLLDPGSDVPDSVKKQSWWCWPLSFVITAQDTSAHTLLRGKTVSRVPQAANVKIVRVWKDVFFPRMDGHVLPRPCFCNCIYTCNINATIADVDLAARGSEVIISQFQACPAHHSR